MAIYRNISMNFWTDSKIVDDFSPEDRYFYLYLLTNPHTNLCGCYEISIKQMMRDTGYNEETVCKLLNRLSNDYNVIKYSKTNKELLINNWVKYNWTKSDKLDKPLLEEIKNIKTPQFKEKLSKLYNERDTVSIPYIYPIDTTVSVSVTDTVSDNITISTKKKKQFISPTLEEIEEYCKQRNNDVDAKKFYEYYTVGNWKDKDGKPIKNWKQKVITWEGRDTNKKIVEKDVPVWFNKEITKEDLLTDEERAWIESIK